MLTNRNSIDQVNIYETNSEDLKQGEVRLKIEHFGFTANNITYAVVGDRFGYWNFFPAPKSPNILGIIPVWGFAQVIESKHEEIKVQSRYFGYFPSGTELIIKPGQITDRSMMDESEHRKLLPRPYNTYNIISKSSRLESEYERMTLGPLYMTSFTIWHATKQHSWYEADQILLLSASSKTSIGTAYAFRVDESAPPVIGMTSLKNKSKLASLDVYSGLVTYNDWSDLDLDKKTLIVDMSGNISIRNQLFERLGEKFQYCLKVGLSHWDASKGKDLPKDKGSVFFAPSIITKWIEEKGIADFHKSSSAFFKDCSDFTRTWFQFELIEGLKNFSAVYPRFIEGKIPSDQLVVIRNE